MNEIFIGQKATLQELFQELDVKSKKLLYLLSHNARFKNKDLGDALDMSPDAIKYRINDLMKRKLITGFTVIFSRRKVGYEVVDLYMSVPSVTESLIKKLQEHKHVCWLATAEGQYNLCVSTNCESVWQVRELILFIRKNVSVNKLLYLPLYYEHGVPHEYLLEGILDRPELGTFKKNHNSFHYEFATRKFDTDERYHLNDVERQVLDSMIKDSRISLNDISLKVYKSVNTVKKIISNLIKKSVIIQFEPKISTVLFGYYWGLLFIRFKDDNTKMQEEFLNFLKKQSYSHWFSYVTGGFDLILSTHAKSSTEFKNIKEELCKKFSTLIELIEDIKIEKQYKHMSVFLP